MTRFLIGAGGWAYFEVPGLHPLVAYSKAFDFVEVNSTFYELPNLKLVESWRRLVPPNFEFAVRCNKALTHKHSFQQIPEAFEVLEKITNIYNTLKAEILHMQTPPTFKPTKTDIETMRARDRPCKSYGLARLRRLKQSVTQQTVLQTRRQTVTIIRQGKGLKHPQADLRK